ncbi:MAG: hypothetical protein LH606_18700 [Cytophagaceae bacterium]|nr:hypothetical protein [Cytophagaceae bacterium]
MKQLIACSLAALLVVSCEKTEKLEKEAQADVCPQGNTVVKVEEGYQKLVGDWTWQKSELVRRGAGTSVETPATTGTSKRFRFNADRTYQFFEAQTINESGTYRLRTVMNDPILILDLTRNGQANGGVLITLCDNGLILLGGANDAGPNEYYARKQ